MEQFLKGSDDMDQVKQYYPFEYRHHQVATIAFYGNHAPIIVKGNLVLRTYYKDEEKTQIDYGHTSNAIMDTIFYETNKVIKEPMDEVYNEKRELVELTMNQLGEDYIIVYNGAEEPSDRYDDRLRILLQRDPEARGVAIILKRTKQHGVTWLTHKEAKQILARFK